MVGRFKDVGESADGVGSAEVGLRCNCKTFVSLTKCSEALCLVRAETPDTICSFCNEDGVTLLGKQAFDELSCAECEL